MKIKYIKFYERQRSGKIRKSLRSIKFDSSYSREDRGKYERKARNEALNELVNLNFITPEQRKELAEKFGLENKRKVASIPINRKTKTPDKTSKISEGEKLGLGAFATAVIGSAIGGVIFYLNTSRDYVGEEIQTTKIENVSKNEFSGREIVLRPGKSMIVPEER